MFYNTNGKQYILKHYTEFEPVPISKKYIIGEKTKYINLPFVYDCEVTSWINAEGKKRATVYIWTAIVFDNIVYYGRTTAEFVEFLQMVVDRYELTKSYKAVCYVHNLSYDSHFFLPWVSDNLSKMFAIDTHKPISFTVSNAIDFKCSLVLSGVKLEKIGEQIGIDKVKGFDYELIRHSKTRLTDDEMKYCSFDVIVLYNYILQQIEENSGKITEIAKTFTGITRRESRSRCQEDNVHMKMYKQCRIDDIMIMDALEHCFQGGYTHCNVSNAGTVLENVDSYDLSSDYPSQMVKQKFPITKFRLYNSTSIPNPDRYASIIKITYFNLKATTQHSIISTSKIYSQFDPGAAVIDNGRLQEYKGAVTLWITEQDFLIYEQFYTYDKYEIERIYISQKGYLSDAFVYHALELYHYKTTLKNAITPEDKLKYRLSKTMINSLYGMCVTNPLKTKWLYEYTEHIVTWKEGSETRAELLAAYNQSKANFLPYQWGVWVTAYARYDLLSTVRKICDLAETFDDYGRPFDDVVYCDTDSIKLLNGYKYKKIFDEFNAENDLKMRESMKFFDLDADTYTPKDDKGNPRPLGVFTYEPNEIDKNLSSYRYFKTLGAKRYVYSFVEDWDRQPEYNEQKKEIVPAAFGITIAGLPKKTARVLVDRALKADVTPFEIFEDGMYISENESGKNCVTYVDSGFTEQLTDYQGNTAEVSEKAYIHITKTSFELGLSSDFMRLINIRKRSDYL